MVNKVKENLIKNRRDKIENFSQYNFLIKNRKGWLEIVEAFVAVLLVAGVLLIILNRGYFQRTDTSEQIYNVEVSILREIQTNDEFRKSIAAAPVPVIWEDSAFPADVKEKITMRTPNYLDCVAKICELNTPCILEGPSLERSAEKDVFSESVVISTILEQEVYRQLNLFCWMK